MSLFGKFGKRKEENNVVKKEEKNGFKLEIKDHFLLLQDRGIVVVGLLQGEMEVGDTAYIIHPDNEVVTARVDGIETGPGQSAERARNQQVGILFSDIKKKEDVPISAVITSIRP